MADFTQLATQYVLSDKPSAERELAKQAAAAIQSSPGNSTVVGRWAASINQWVASSSTDDNAMDTDGGDVIARAKALSFMADTLDELDRNSLRTDQVNRLVAFFCSLFNIDHKAGISPATKSLKSLRDMKNFSPKLGSAIIEGICNLKDDFRLQTPTTRFEIYNLVQSLLNQPSVLSELQSRYDSSPGFVADLVSQCRTERDPRNLIEWFRILDKLLSSFPTLPEVNQEIFSAFSAYFPISLRDSATETGVTVPELKGALRRCFAAKGGLSALAFPFLLQKLDQGGLNVGVKMDILETIQSCVQGYENVQSDVVPFVDKLWDSLKYEVRNGEVEESINKTLEVFHAMAQKLNSSDKQDLIPKDLEDFVNLVCADCIDDISNPTYTASAGEMLVSVLGSSTRAFLLATPKTLTRVKENINQPKSPAHIKDLTAFLNQLLESRIGLLNRGTVEPQDESYEQVLSAEVSDLLHQVYLPIWRQNMVPSPNREQVAISKETMRGLALLIRQPGDQGGLACPPTACTEICKTLSYKILHSLILSSAMEPKMRLELEDEAVLALQKCVMAYGPGFAEMISDAQAAISQCEWKQGVPKDQLDILDQLLKRLAFIGCSEIPRGSNPLGYFVTFTSSLLRLLHRMLTTASDFKAITTVLSGIYAAILNYKDACGQKFELDAHSPQFSSSWWTEVAQKYPSKAIGEPPAETGCDETRNKYGSFPLIDKDLPETEPQESAENQLSADDPEVIREFLRLSLLIVVQLYRRAVKLLPEQDGKPAGASLSDDFRVLTQKRESTEGGSLQLSQDQYLYGLANMATSVLRLLSEAEQSALQLSQQPYLLWTGEPVAQPTWSDHDDGRTNVLSLGIVRALWPSVIEQTHICRNLMSDIVAVRDLPDRTQEVRDAIATIMANKYPKAQSSVVPEQKEISYFLQVFQSEDSICRLSLNEWSRALSMTAGAIMRLDRSLAQLAPKIILVPGASASDADVRARLMDILVRPKDYLTPENHAVVKPLFKGWVYAYFVKPMIPLAYPFQQERPRAGNYTLAVLYILRHLPYNVYQDDVEGIARILIASLDLLTAAADLEAAFAILLGILGHEPAALRDHLKAIINGAVRAYNKTKKAGRDMHIVGSESAASAFPRRLLKIGNTAPCRRDAVVLLGRLPGAGLEERYLLPYAPALRRTLADMSGDPVREVRQAVLAAREAWLAVV